MKKRGMSFRRGLSIFLSALMILCAVPLVSFAAIDPIIPDAAGVEAIDRSSSDIYVVRNFPAQTDTISAGMRLGDFVFKKTGCTLRQAKPDGSGFLTTYATTKLSVEFVNKDDVAKPGENKEPVIIYVTADPSIWVKVWYTFEAVQGSGIPEAVIEELPVIESPVTYQEDLKASDLKLSGGEANVPGTFSFTNPEQKLSSVGTYQISVTFTPADPAAAEPVAVTVPVTVEKGIVQVNVVPVITISYGTVLKNVKNFAGAETTPSSGVSWDWSGLTGLGESDERVSQLLPVGEYNDIMARVSTPYNNNYIPSFTPVKVIVTPVTTPLQISLSIRDGVVSLRTNVINEPGTLTWKANGEVIAEGVKGTETFEWTAPASGSYELTVEYVPGEGDVGYAYTMGRQTIEIVMPHAVTVTGGSGSGNYKPGDTVRVDFDQTTLKKNHEFKSWKITNAKGETIDVGAELTATSISFTMPDEAVNVEATSAFSIQLFFKNIGDSIMAFFMKIAEWFMGIFGGLGSLS